MHDTVLLHEAVEALRVKPGSMYIDCTFGRGGHSRQILKSLRGSGELYALDQDLEAVRFANEDFRGEPGFHVLHESFENLAQIINRLGLENKVAGILMDLGVSSPQLEDASRGFSFQADGPLDMRMNQSSSLTAEQWLYTASIDEMKKVFYQYGEEKNALGIARKIAKAREHERLTRTVQLAELVSQCVPRNNQRIHPATRVFQAIRIHINNELGALHTALSASVDALTEGGRLVVISFHSLEDRLVKRFLRGEPEAIELRRIPISHVNKIRIKAVGKLVTPGEMELNENPRARSARMRIGEKC